MIGGFGLPIMSAIAEISTGHGVIVMAAIWRDTGPSAALPGFPEAGGHPREYCRWASFGGYGAMSDQIDPEMARPWLLRSKLELPRNNVRLVRRPRLRARMQKWFDLDLATVIAPAGYAKSTTVAEWCREAREAGAVVAWFSLDEGDAEPTQFVSYLVASLSTAGLDLKGLEVGAEEGFFASGIPPALSAVLDAVAQAGRPVVVVLDDYYRLGSTAVDVMVRGLLQNIPTNMTFVVTSRGALPFDIANLLAAGRADELTSEALRFTADELAAVFEQPVSEEALALLLERTEGWPVAVQLAKLLVGDDPSSVRFDNFHGDSGHIATYLADQIVSNLEADLQSFLLQTASLETFQRPARGGRHRTTGQPSHDRAARAARRADRTDARRRGGLSLPPSVRRISAQRTAPPLRRQRGRRGQPARVALV